MTLACVKNRVVFIKPFWYYCKVMSESTDADISIFSWRIHSIVICIVAKCIVSIKRKRSLIKVLKSRGPRIEPWGMPVNVFCHLLNLYQLLLFGVCYKNSFGWKLERLYQSHQALVYKEGGCGSAYHKNAYVYIVNIHIINMHMCEKMWFTKKVETEILGIIVENNLIWKYLEVSKLIEVILG